ncbi:MAG TPA: hypothetical protein VNF70_02655 [Pyrinomonadaceae bacterium]|nr:hypothetical protein [Pyrinomonadaceae bacterium]
MIKIIGKPPSQAFISLDRQRKAVITGQEFRKLADKLRVAEQFVSVLARIGTSCVRQGEFIKFCSSIFAGGGQVNYFGIKLLS